MAYHRAEYGSDVVETIRPAFCSSLTSHEIDGFFIEEDSNRSRNNIVLNLTGREFLNLDIDPKFVTFKVRI